MNFGQSWSYYLWAGKLPGKTIPSFTSDSKLLDKGKVLAGQEEAYKLA